VILLIYSIFANTPKVPPKITQPDECISCHSGMSDIDHAHPKEIFGCAACHGGNKYATNKKDAHKGMVLNPSSLAHASIFCSKCHKKIIKRISKSMMNSQSGILNVLMYQWGESKDLNSTIGINDIRGSNRIGFTYEGIFESAGYGTPYKHGHFSHEMVDGRFYYNIPPDIHHSKANMSCIDCHSEKGVMGDGKKHFHMEQAEDVKCKDCHKPKFGPPDSLAVTLSSLNGHIKEAKLIAYTKKKHAPLYNVQKINNKVEFFRKKDGKEFNLTLMSNKPYHTLAFHKRLACSACHSPRAPSCYGCHEVYFQNGKQYDWVANKVTKGQWQEFRSFLRFEEPSLGVGYNKKIMPFAPGCCISCHFSPTALGLGRGNLDIKDGNITFEPIYNSTKSGMPFSYPIDAFVSVKGKQFQSTSRKYARSFNEKEIKKIVGAYKCIICHNTYSDKIYKDFNKSKKLFYEGKTSCLK